MYLCVFSVRKINFCLFSHCSYVFCFLMLKAFLSRLGVYFGPELLFGEILIKLSVANTLKTRAHHKGAGDNISSVAPLW